MLAFSKKVIIVLGVILIVLVSGFFLWQISKEETDTGGTNLGGSQAESSVAEGITIQGIVLENFSGCVINDPRCFIRVQSDAREFVVTYGYGRVEKKESCLNRKGSERGFQSGEGEEVIVFGKLEEDAHLTICPEAGYYIRNLTDEAFGQGPEPDFSDLELAKVSGSWPAESKFDKSIFVEDTQRYPASILTIEEWQHQTATQWQSTFLQRLGNKELSVFDFTDFHTAIFSPDKKKILFTVRTKDFSMDGFRFTLPGILDIESGFISTILQTGTKFPVKEVMWSPQQTYITLVTDYEIVNYDLETERALVVDQNLLIESGFKSLVNRDRAEELAVMARKVYIPEFRNATWVSNESRLEFDANTNFFSKSSPGTAFYSMLPPRFYVGADGRTYERKVLEISGRNRLSDDYIWYGTQLLGIDLGCEESLLSLECYRAVAPLFSNNNFIPSEIAESDGALKDYLQRRFSAMASLEISRGMFDTLSDANLIFVSFQVEGSSSGEERLLVLRLEQDGATAHDNGVIKFYVYQNLLNEPQYLVRGAVPFFVVVETSSIGESCTPFQWKKALYYLEAGMFTRIWDGDYYRNGKFDDGEQIEDMIAEIRFEDLDGDGNKEIIQEGIQRFCVGSEEACYSRDCRQTISSVQTRRIFQWDELEQQFQEAG